MALILDRTMGLVSPQFQVIFDTILRMEKQEKFDLKWKAKAVLFVINNKEIKIKIYPCSETI